MKKKIIKIASILMTLVMLFSLAACDGDDVAEIFDLTENGVYQPTGTVSRAVNTDDDNPGDGTNYKLTVWCADEDYEMIWEMLRKYETKYYKNSYEWTVQRVGEDKAATRVLDDVTAAADVFSFANDQIGKLVKNNALMEIPAKYIPQVEQQIEIAQRAASVSNTYYALPYSLENCFLYYNKSKITNVSSLEEILSASITGVRYNIGINMGDSYYTTAFLYTAGVEIFGKDGDDASVETIRGSLNNEKAIAACKYIQGLSKEQKLDTIDENDQAAALSSGKIASLISGPHKISEFKDALGENFAVATLPTININGETKQLVSFAGVKMYGVTRNPNRDGNVSNEAMRLAAYLSNSDNQEVRLEEREFCPTNDELFDAALSSGVDTVKVVVEQNKKSKLKPGLIEMSGYWEPMGSFLLGVYLNKKADSTWAEELKKIEDKIMPVT